MKFYGKRRNLNKKRATKKRNYKVRGVTSAVKRYVKRTIHSNIENKTATKNSVGNIVTSYAQDSALGCDSLIPYLSMTQQFSQNARIGNQIRIRKCLLSYSLRPNGIISVTNPNPVPQEVMLYFGKVKNAKPQKPISSDFAKMFQLGSTTFPFQSNLSDMFMEVNKDYFTIVKQIRHKIGAASIAAVSGTAAYPNNDYKLNVIKKLNLTQHCPKMIRFNDNTPEPTNDGLWFWIEAVAADGTANSLRPVIFDYQITVEFEDA